MLKAEGLVKTFKISEKQRKALELESRIKTAVNGVSFTAKPVRCSDFSVQTARERPPL